MPPPSMGGSASRSKGLARPSTSPASAASSPPTTPTTAAWACGRPRSRPIEATPTIPATVAKNSSDPAIPPHSAATRYDVSAWRRHGRPRESPSGREGGSGEAVGAGGRQQRARLGGGEEQAVGLGGLGGGAGALGDGGQVGGGQQHDLQRQAQRAPGEVQ